VVLVVFRAFLEDDRSVPSHSQALAFDLARVVSFEILKNDGIVVVQFQEALGRVVFLAPEGEEIPRLLDTSEGLH